MKQRIKKILHDRCITATAAIAETGLSRNAFYLYQEKNYPIYSRFILKHSGDFIFTPEKFNKAIDKSGLTQLQLWDKINIHNVTLSLFLSGKKRPSRAAGDYDSVRLFCKEFGV